MQRAIRLLVLVLVIGLGALWGAAWFGRTPGEPLGSAFLRQFAAITGRGGEQPVAGNGIRLPSGVSMGGAFAMQDQDGRSVTQADFGGRLLVGYFGYSFCPDVCPTELATIANAFDLLTPAEAARATPLFVTVDPERDTPAQMKSYVANFHPRMVGLTGSPEQVAAMAKLYRVFYAKVQRPEMSEYLMDHSSFVYLIGADGRVRALLRPQSSAEDIAQAIRAQLAGA
jgi:cytochrome oxidase Cu insertion factor (SCO1/SenC/PrrC family)